MALDNKTLETKLNYFKEKLESFKSENLSLDMTRGKPAPEQLSISEAICNSVSASDLITENGVDTRNYGGLAGLPEGKELFSQLIQVDSSEVLLAGNSSLTLMFQYLNFAFHFGLEGEASKWSKENHVSILCPVPGYDRHFTICKVLGIKMIPVPMNDNGPDMSEVERLIESDKSIRGMWCVPKYSNPSGIIYSDDTVKRIASLGKKAHSTFRVLWDNAYAVHDLYEFEPLLPIMNEAKKAKCEDHIVIFGSTSKITFAGAGVACLGLSPNNADSFKEFLSYQTIGPDKVNQLRHIKFLKSYENLKSHMEEHAKLIRPKFEAVNHVLEHELGELEVASWNLPKGGYFISLDTLPGLAKRTVSLCGEVGVKLTPAGATYPYGDDPKDCNIRIAPSFPSLEDVKKASEVLATAIGLLSCESLLNSITSKIKGFKEHISI